MSLPQLKQQKQKQANGVVGSVSLLLLSSLSLSYTLKCSNSVCLAPQILHMYVPVIPRLRQKTLAP